jgi:hypothetical protein
MKNYYFKFQTENRGFGLWLEREKGGRIIPLSIYYGQWEVADLESGLLQRTASAKRQIITFFNLEKVQEEVFFWVFYLEKVYCFKGVDLKVFDGPEWGIYPGYGDLPKSINAELIVTYEKINLPEFFSNINANQRYNRGTICELSGPANMYAKSLISGERIKISMDNFHEYLSPMEFETLIFMIFNNGGNLCSSFRGGTLKDYDLRVRLPQDYYGMPAGQHWIQVKLKQNEKLKIDGFLVSICDKSDLGKRIIGIDWIRDRVRESTSIQAWMKDMTLNYKNIDFSL